MARDEEILIGVDVILSLEYGFIERLFLKLIPNTRGIHCEYCDRDAWGTSEALDWTPQQQHVVCLADDNNYCVTNPDCGPNRCCLGTHYTGRHCADYGDVDQRCDLPIRHYRQHCPCLEHLTCTVKLKQRSRLALRRFYDGKKLKQRICIEFCVKLQILATETFEMLNKAFHNDAPKKTTVFEWHSRFKFKI
ncbi:hypothetical protein LAZ67_4000957 [Cordylochernes scorpioides]|uniref:Mos1 transposase HTH domain-containing protein n=1 Tax=Cordylochernes scorpioides TaxID=51811 RepID=A0ABY6KBT3_9ARAC|nr:hypothetical protein LAZ67_4000957 [Cordylochernes scorpioides]